MDVGNLVLRLQDLVFLFFLVLALKYVLLNRLARLAERRNARLHESEKKHKRSPFQIHSGVF